MAGRNRSFRWASWAVAASASALVLTGAATASVVPGHGTLARRLSSHHAMGLIKTTPARVSAAESGRVRAAAVSLPSSVDLTPYAMPVGNQGPVGSCAAWAADYSALGYWENKQGLGAVALEPMYTYAQVTGGHDYGSTIEGNLYVDETQGVDDQADYPQGNFDYWDQPTAAERAHAVIWKLSTYADLPIQPSTTSTVTQQSIEAALAAGNPVVIGIPVYDNFFSVNSANHGSYAGPSGSYDGNHAITALGYNSTGLVIENSWGTGWGNHGYATLAWSFVNRYVFDAVSVSKLRVAGPVSATTPAVTGTARQGVKLTVSTGSWNPTPTAYAYQWQRSTDSGSTWTNIGGATTSSYTPGIADLGVDLRAVVTASNATGAAPAASDPVGPVASGAPVNATVPHIAGALRVGQTLSTGGGTWNPAATSYAFQWERSTDSGSTWTAIPRATSATYVTTFADANAYVLVRVTVSNVYGTAPAVTSPPVGPVSGAPFLTAAPVVTGAPARGTALHAGAGTWSPAPASYAYQWQTLPSGSTTWSDISGATASTYTPAQTDENARLRVVVTGTNIYGQAVGTSAATAAVKASPPVNTAAPKVLGIAALGHTLSLSAGSWLGVGNSYSYQWQRYLGGTWSPITGATGVTYVPTSSDHGALIRVVLTATNVDGSATAASPATLKVP